MHPHAPTHTLHSFASASLKQVSQYKANQKRKKAEKKRKEKDAHVRWACQECTVAITMKKLKQKKKKKGCTHKRWECVDDIESRWLVVCMCHTMQWGTELNMGTYGIQRSKCIPMQWGTELPSLTASPTA
jgi:hypothetical protein